MGKLVKMNTIIIGLRGVGVEIAKNLILAGPASVSIVDTTPVAKRDMGANFFLEDAHVDSCSRAEACVQKLSELNDKVKVKAMSMEEMH